jgi:obg-like ATPase 1
LFLTSKPALYLVNLSEKDYIRKKNKWLNQSPIFNLVIGVFTLFRLIKIKEWVDKHDPGAMIVPFSGVFESKLADMSDDEKKTYQKEQGATR